jgi:DNA gyrase subunit A
VITQNGYGKKTAVSEYQIKGRGGKGIKTAQITEKNGPLAGVAVVQGGEDVVLTTNMGVMIRFNVATVSETGRATQGVRLIRLDEEATVATFTTVEPEPEEDTTVTDDSMTEQVEALVDRAMSEEADTTEA